MYLIHSPLGPCWEAGTSVYPRKAPEGPLRRAKQRTRARQNSAGGMRYGHRLLACFETSDDPLQLQLACADPLETQGAHSSTPRDISAPDPRRDLSKKKVALEWDARGSLLSFALTGGRPKASHSSNISRRRSRTSHRNADPSSCDFDSSAGLTWSHIPHREACPTTAIERSANRILGVTVERRLL